MAVSCILLSQNSIAKGALLQYGFALDVKEILPDETVCEITIDRRLRHRSIHYDESNEDLQPINENDNEMSTDASR